MKRVAILIDGGYLRQLAKQAALQYNPDLVERFARACPLADEEILRILYYDCAPYQGRVRLPVSGIPYQFDGSDQWLTDLAAKDLFAVRRGVLKFRGFTPKKTPIPHAEPTDNDFSPSFEQKGVDMRIGLDICVFSTNRAADRILLASNDTDCVPALKHARRAGLQVIIVHPPDVSCARELVTHSDFRRTVPLAGANQPLAALP